MRENVTMYRGRTAPCNSIQISMLQHNCMFVQSKNRINTHLNHLTCGAYLRPQDVIFQIVHEISKKKKDVVWLYQLPVMLMRRYLAGKLLPPNGKLRAFLSPTVNAVKLFIASIHRPKWLWSLWSWRWKAAHFVPLKSKLWCCSSILTSFIDIIDIILRLAFYHYCHYLQC